MALPVAGRTSTFDKEMPAAEITSGLYSALRRPNGWQSVQHFCLKVTRADKASVLNGLLATFEERSYTAHEVACAVLWAYEIPYTRDLASDLPRILDSWDVSVEELPFYLVEACGRQAVEEALARIQDFPNQSPSMKQKVETMHYWMQVPYEAVQEAKAEWFNKLNLGEQVVAPNLSATPIPKSEFPVGGWDG